MSQILVLCDDMWHPAEVIQKGLAPLEGDEFHFDFVMAAKDILTPELIAEYPLIICCKGNSVIAANRAPWFENTVTEVMAPEFRAYVEAGGGFLCVHSGNTFGGDGDGVAEYREFVGNRFTGHPLRCGIVAKKCSDHPIMAGVADEFDIRDEHYQMTDIAEDADVFLKTTSPKGGTQVAGYTRAMGKGRLCVLTPGHVLSVWHHPEFQKILVNAMNWCMDKQGGAR